MDLLVPNIDVLKIGVGSVQFGMDYGIGNTQGQTTANQVKEILEVARKYKVDFIDTAAAYGNAEIILGQNDLTGFNVVSKYMPQASGTIKQQLNATLKHLKLNSLYGYLAHRPLDLLDNPAQWDELQIFKRSGLVKKIGFSLNAPIELDKLLDKGFNPSIVQVPYNYFDRRFEDQLIRLKQSGCEIHTRSAFLQGLFFADLEKLPSFFDEIKDAINAVQNSVKHLPVSLLKFVTQKVFIDKVIIGVNNAKHLKYNIEMLNLAEELPALNYTLQDKFLMPSNWPK